MSVWSRPAIILRLSATVTLLVSTLLFVLWTWHWPLFGDASLIHYICFLMDHGMSLYKDLGDMNMPGVFLLEWTWMHAAGGGDLAWRIYDFLLLAVASGAITMILYPYDWFAAVFASALLALVHGRDGLAQVGQRDLEMAVLAIAATAFLMQSLRKEKPWYASLFGLFAGMAVTIKPTLLPLIGFLACVSFFVLRQRRKPIVGYAWRSFIPFLIAPSVCVFFLVKNGILSSFWEGLHGIVPYYASLGHKPIGFLLDHSISPLLPLVVVWCIAIVAARVRFTWERVMLFAGVVFGLVSYVVQARGYPYYRYPLLVFLLPLISMDLSAVLRVPGWKAWLAGMGVAFGSFYLAPASAYLTHQYEWWNLDFIDSLSRDLKQLGGADLSGHMQCIDSVSGCGTALYRLRLVQSTGVLSDFLLFGPGSVPVVQKTRAELLHKSETDPPRVLVVSGGLHIDGPNGFRKLQLWPELGQLLSDRYCLAKQWDATRPHRAWSRREVSDSYRIYLLRASAIGNSGCPKTASPSL